MRAYQIDSSNSRAWGANGRRDGAETRRSNSASAAEDRPYATIAIKSHVSITLELKNPNFKKWKAFRSMCGKFGLLDDTLSPQETVDPGW
uniref:Uncharacterized protein n=1 Tax=Oryza brachyantha TaxID=4533 RepID=J3LC66_ORYBR